MVLCSAVRNDIILSMYIKPTFFNKQPMDTDAELAFERPGSLAYSSCTHSERQKEQRS